MHWEPHQQILVPFDYSDESLRAIRVGLALSADRSKLCVVHVLDHLPSGEAQYYWEAARGAERLTQATDRLHQTLANADLGQVQAEVLVGDPATEIVARAKALGASLIVLPSHGYGGLKRLLLGSVAQGVVRHAECNVLVLRD